MQRPFQEKDRTSTNEKTTQKYTDRLSLSLSLSSIRGHREEYLEYYSRGGVTGTDLDS